MSGRSHWMKAPRVEPDEEDEDDGRVVPVSAEGRIAPVPLGSKVLPVAVVRGLTDPESVGRDDGSVAP